MFGCAHFAYRFYGISGVSYENGTLLGPDPSQDIPFSTCAPTALDKSPCVVMLSRDFFALRADFQDTQNALKACQQQGH